MMSAMRPLAAPAGRRSGVRSIGEERPKLEPEILEAAAVKIGVAAAAAVQQRQFAAKALQHDFRGLALIAFLVGEFARLQLALDIDLRALLQILLRDLAEILVEDHDIMPFGAILALALRPCRARIRSWRR